MAGVLQAQAPAPGRVTGTVHVAGDSHDPTAASHEMVGDAQVLLLETKYVAQANARGEFELDSVPPGQYVVEARRIGFRPARQVIRVEPNGNLTVALHM